MLDTLIIGAGAAGLAAARQLHDSGQQILVVEARDRIGGRIWTDSHATSFPIELGAEFIHGETAATMALIQAAGLTTLPVTRLDEHLRWALPGQTARLRPELPHEFQILLDRLFADYAALALSPQEPDRSLASYLMQRGWEAEAIRIADVLLAQTCCAHIDELSCADLIREQQVDHAGKLEFRIEEGYAALLNHYSAGLPIHLNTAVKAVRWSDQEVTVVTADEQEFQAKRCILTLPVSLLAANAIHFDPPLRAEKQRAIAAFRTEAATKLIYHFNQPLWDEELTYMCHAGTVARWWTPGYGRGSTALLSAYVTADRGRIIDSMSEADALALGLYELSGLLGFPLDQLQQELLTSRRIAWAHDPYARGGYAHVPPGQANARVILAQPEGRTLFFAGEATAHDSNPQTVHGAFESGWRAARECS